MTNKSSLILAICTMIFFGIINITKANATEVNSVDITDFSKYGILNSYSNICKIKYSFKSSQGIETTGGYYIFSNASIKVAEDYNTGSEAGYLVNTTSPHGWLELQKTTLSDVISESYGDNTQRTQNGLNLETTILNCTQLTSSIYSIKGNNLNKDGTTIQEPIDETIVSKENILNYNWNGNGIKIYNLDEGMKISGYEDNESTTTGVKMFDVETYGKFTYKGSNTFFTSIAYKKMQTEIQNSSVVTFGALTRRMGEGLGIKSFQWVSDTSKLNTGDTIRYRAVYKVPMLGKGTYNIILGTTINDGATNSYYSDQKDGVIFLNSNWNYGEVPNTDGETGNVGNEPGNTPTQETGGTSNGSLSSMLVTFASFSSFIGSLFGFLPTEIKVLFVGACTIITGLMVKRAVL